MRRQGGPKQVLFFLVQFAALLSMLALPWHGIDVAFARGGGAAASAIISLCAPDVTLVPAGREGPPGTNGWYTLLELRDGTTGQPTKVPFNLRYAYLPIAVFLSLAVAAPLQGWKRNLAVVGGGFAIMLLVALCLAVIPMFYVLARTATIHVGSIMRGAIETYFDALVTPTMMYAIPFLVWWMLMAVTRPLASSSPSARK